MAHGAIARERDGRIVGLGIPEKEARPEWLVQRAEARRRELAKQRWEDRQRKQNRFEDEEALALRKGAMA